MRDHGGQHLDVSDLFRADIEHYVLVFGGSGAVPALEQVGNHDAHLAPLPADQLLQLAKSGWLDVACSKPFPFTTPLQHLTDGQSAGTDLVVSGCVPRRTKPVSHAQAATREEFQVVDHWSDTRRAANCRRVLDDHGGTADADWPNVQAGP